MNSLVLTRPAPRPVFGGMPMLMADSLYPLAKRCVTALLSHGLTYGSTLEAARVARLYGLEAAPLPPFEPRLARALDEVAAELLSEHAMLLAPNGDGSYRVLAPHEQTAYVLEAGIGAVTHELRRMGQALAHVNHALLDAPARAASAEAAARLAQLAGLVAKEGASLRALLD